MPSSPERAPVQEGTRDDEIIIIENVHKSFTGGIEAVRNFTARIRRGEVVVIMGPSGSGKSTLLRCLNGLEQADSGTIIVDGIPLDHDRAHRLEIRKEVGMVFQSFNLFPHLTVLENINLAQRRVRKKSLAEATERSMELLRTVGIADKANAYPAQLSGGQQQRVAIARAIVNNPRLIVCDEPTSALDADTGRLVMDVLRRNALSQARALIIVTHDNRIFSFADRIARMDDGRITLVEPQVATS